MQPVVDEDGAAILDANGKDRLEVVDEVRFCRWRWEVASDFNPSARNVEGDRFHFRVPKSAKEILEGTTATIAVDEIEGQGTLVTSDPATEFEFAERPLIQGTDSDYLLSPPFYLVADVTDDVAFNGDAASDNEKNDTTHLGGFNARISLALSGSIEDEFSYRAMKPIGKVYLKLSYLADRNEILSEETKAFILEQFKRIRDIYRQIGIEVVQVGEVGEVFRTERMEEIEEDGIIDGRLDTSEWEQWLIDVLNHAVQVGGPYIHCVFTYGPISEKLSDDHDPGTLGWHRSFDGIDGVRRQLVVVPVNAYGTTPAHEVGHALGLLHSNEEGEVDIGRLMSSEADVFDEDHKDQKRFRFVEPGIIMESPNLKAP